MNRVRKGLVLAAAVVLGLCVAGSFLTRGVMENLGFLHGQKSGWGGGAVQSGIVDQRPWKTAETLAALAVSAEERELAREAERLADHEVDQAFAQSLRQAGLVTRDLKGEALQLQQRVTELAGAGEGRPGAGGGADREGGSGWECATRRRRMIWMWRRRSWGSIRMSCLIRWRTWRGRAGTSGRRFSRS